MNRKEKSDWDRKWWSFRQWHKELDLIKDAFLNFFEERYIGTPGISLLNKNGSATYRKTWRSSVRYISARRLQTSSNHWFLPLFQTRYTFNTSTLKLVRSFPLHSMSFWLDYSLSCSDPVHLLWLQVRNIDFLTFIWRRNFPFLALILMSGWGLHMPSPTRALQISWTRLHQ